MADLQRFGLDRRQLAHLHLPVHALDLRFQVAHHLLDDLAQIDLHEIAGPRVTRDSVKQALDQLLHPRGGALHAADALLRRFVQEVLALHFQPVAEGADLAQRFLQVVRGHVGELLQIAVGSLQFGRIAGLLLFGLLAGADVADEKGQHRRAVDLADGHGQLGVKHLAVGPRGRDFDALAEHRSLARFQVALDAAAVLGAQRGREEHVGRPRAEHLLAGVAEGLLRGPIELDDRPLVIDGDDRIER